MTMRSLHRGSVPLYLCSRPWGRRCFRLQSADRGRTKSGARLESAERGQGDERAASERGPANTVVIRALTTKNPIRPPCPSRTWHHTWSRSSCTRDTRTARIPSWAWPLARQVFVYYMYEYDDSTYSKRYAHHGAPSGAPLATPVSARERAQALVAHARSQNPASRKCRRARYDAWHGPRNTSTRPVQGGRLSRLGRRGERLVRVERRPRRPGGRPKGILKGPMRARHGAHERQHRRLRGHAAARRHVLQ
jgi:hypothetical protein